MKKYIYLIIISFLHLSCTEEVFIDELNNVETRLVIEANIDINKNDNTTTSTQTITITNTSSFYSQDYPPVSGAIITVTDLLNNSVATFVETIDPGVYQATDFKTPSIGDTYKLTVVVGNEIYTAQDTYTDIVDINSITQGIISFPNDIIELSINIDNEIGVDNFYLFQIDTPFRVIPEYGNADDELLNENPGENNYDFVYFDEELETGMDIGITIYGISETYNNYLTKILTLSQESGSPFSTAPATVRGNFLNTTNQNNYTLGFFSLNQFVTTTYTIEQ